MALIINKINGINVGPLGTVFTGGTVTGSTVFTGGLTANTFSATSISAVNYVGLPIDVRVTGGTFSSSSSTIIFTNNTGGTFNVTGISVSSSSSSAFTGGTVSGSTTFTGGLTANTLNIGSVVAGTSVNNLGVDATGRVVIGTSGGSSGGTDTDLIDYLTMVSFRTLYNF